MRSGIRVPSASGAALFVLTLTSSLVLLLLGCIISGVDSKKATESRAAQSDSCQGPCKLNIRRDFPKDSVPGPIYLHPDTEKEWLPNRRGDLQIREGEAIELICSKGFDSVRSRFDAGKVIQKNVTRVKATCECGNYFEYDGAKYAFDQFVCVAFPDFTMELTDEKCARDADIYRVGYKLQDERFVEGMRICFDERKLISHYTKHQLHPGSGRPQFDVSRIDFQQLGFSPEHNLMRLYTRYVQKRAATELMGSKDIEGQYWDRDTFLSRGHLAAKSDFVYGYMQRATFVYYNVAPQWQPFNGGNWGTLEKQVRRFATRRALNLDCYTGTWGVFELQNPRDKNDSRPFYLAKDRDGDSLLPVPKYYYRVIIDRDDPKRGIVLIGVNSSHLGMAEFQKDYIFCNNIADKVAWLRWLSNKDMKSGYLFACSVEDFIEHVDTLPQSLKNVNEILQ